MPGKLRSWTNRLGLAAIPANVPCVPWQQFPLIHITTLQGHLKEVAVENWQPIAEPIASSADCRANVLSSPALRTPKDHQGLFGTRAFRGYMLVAYCYSGIYWTSMLAGSKDRFMGICVGESI